MKEKTLFIGVSKHTGKTYTGDLIVDKTTNPISFAIVTEQDSGLLMWYDYRKYDILSETIGQYVGISDINGSKIFSNFHIIKFKFQTGLNQFIYLMGIFYYDDIELRYQIEVYSDDNPEYVCLNYKWNGEMFDFEIIGDVYNNPELLKYDE